MNAGGESSPARYAAAAAEAVRELNWATIAAARYGSPAEVDATVGELAILIQRLPQAFAQAADWLETAHAYGRVGHDGQGDPGHSVDLVAGLLHEAALMAGQLAWVLFEARNHTSHLTGLDGPVSPNGGTR